MQLIIETKWENKFMIHRANMIRQTVQAHLEQLGLAPPQTAWRCLRCGHGQSGDCNVTACPNCGHAEIMIWDADGNHHMLTTPSPT